MKLYFFDIPTSAMETVVDSDEYDALAAKKISGHKWAQDEAELKWESAGTGPMVTYAEYQQAKAHIAELEQRISDLEDEKSNAYADGYSDGVSSTH